MLVIMALATTFMTTPLLSVFYRAAEIEAMVSAAEGADASASPEGPRKYRILVSVARSALAHELVHTAMRLARDADEDAEIVLLRVLRLPGSAYRAGPRAQQELARRASQSLRPLVQLVEGAGYDAVPVVVAASNIADAIVTEAKTRQPDLVLLGWHRSLWGNRLLGGAVGEVLRGGWRGGGRVGGPQSRGGAPPQTSQDLV